jgi:hypothetical protein
MKSAAILNQLMHGRIQSPALQLHDVVSDNDTREAFMRNTAIFAGLAVAAVFLIRAMRGKNDAEILEEKVHELQDHFKRLDAEA